jgi:hypothetical protein
MSCDLSAMIIMKRGKIADKLQPRNSAIIIMKRASRDYAPFSLSLSNVPVAVGGQNVLQSTLHVTYENTFCNKLIL